MESRRKKHTSQHMERVHKIKVLLLCIEILIIVVLTAAISLLTLHKTDEALKNKVTVMTEALNVQMRMNLHSYMLRMETIGTLVFANDAVYQYDATRYSSDSYEAIQQEAVVKDFLFDISIMENFVDFGIVYSNNHTIGKFSNGTHALFGDQLYAALTDMITSPATHDGWNTGYEDNYKRLYYVKQVNENAVLVLSVYTYELNDVFQHPGGIQDITVQMISDDNIVIYSSDSLQEGKLLPQDILTRIDGQSASTIIDNAYLVTLSSCDSHWRIICSAPTRIILKEKNEVMLFIIVIALIAMILASIATYLLLEKLTHPVKIIVNALNEEAHLDLLTGIYNKRSFEKIVQATLETTPDSDKKALLLMDVDNFKGVNDTLGHAYGDKVLAGIGDILKRVFHTDDILGRLGGDEFCVFLNITDSQQTQFIQHIEQKCEALCKEFHHNYTGADNDYKISVSIGAAVFPMHGQSFAELYQSADRALYHSKHAGKDTYTIYDTGMEKEAAE